ncbi:hypothetical protein AOR_1_12134 [Paecilomyces variotii No. 5]|uniref:Fungal-specific transcription factor domain-containing protein n=1 Tax=Byssochlamys spectabilis (strain No. 5 / NBRC 109023) TaxID=1356009 RepID=V5G5X4_BYSSN|nr:hypothetical protein AOR_1_12134 [Paecilomyces variotii No. 5]
MGVMIRQLLLDGRDKSPIESYLQEIYLVFSIFGSISSSVKSTHALFPDHIVEDVLRRAETHSWTGCPAELLAILYTINRLSSDSYELSSDDIAILFNRLEQFSPSEWANGSRMIKSKQQRYRLASVYKTAIHMFGSRVLYRSNEPYPENTINTALAHLSSIRPDDTHFKAIVWPAFVVGMEAYTTEQWNTTARIFGDLYDFFRTSHLKHAMVALQNIWTHSLSENPKRTWLKYLDMIGYELLFV